MSDNDFKLDRIKGIMTPEQSTEWYKNHSKHFDPKTGLLATGFPGKWGRYKVHICGHTFWVMYNLLYGHSRDLRVSTKGQVIVHREMFEDQGIHCIASDSEPHYIGVNYLVLPSGYRQKVFVGVAKFEDVLILKLKGSKKRGGEK